MRRASEQPTAKPRRRAMSPEAREDQLINLSFNAVEKRIRNGTASSQELIHFLKLGTQRERIEREILEKQKELITAKTEALQSQKRVEELYEKAITVMREYQGLEVIEEEEEE